MMLEMYFPCLACLWFQGFDELLELAEQGEHRNIDMLVRDIYGGAYSALGLPPDLIASSFGKAARSAQDKDSKLLFQNEVNYLLCSFLDMKSH